MAKKTVAKKTAKPAKSAAKKPAKKAAAPGKAVKKAAPKKAASMATAGLKATVKASAAKTGKTLKVLAAELRGVMKNVQRPKGDLTKVPKPPSGKKR